MSSSRRLVAVIAMMSTLLLGSPALAGNPFQTVEFPVVFEDAGYAECLGENLKASFQVTLKFRELETPSGNWLRVEHGWWEAEWEGLTTGRKWLDTGQSPGTFHTTKQGEITQWTSQGKAVPIDHDGPQFRYNQRLKYKIDENGEFVWFSEPPEIFADWIRCLGPKG